LSINFIPKSKIYQFVEFSANSRRYSGKNLISMKISLAFVLVFFLLGPELTFSQSAREIEIAIADSIYRSNIKKSRINGVYIPKNLEEAFRELDELSEEKDRIKFRLADEQTIAKKLFFGLGRWMSYNWHFEAGSRFTVYLNGLGIVFPDDMITFMLVSYHRHLNKKELEVDKRVKEIQEMRAKQKEEERKNAEVIETKTQKLDSIPEKYNIND
jgi:hypothetical protein